MLDLVRKVIETSFNILGRSILALGIQLNTFKHEKTSLHIKNSVLFLLRIIYFRR